MKTPRSILHVPDPCHEAWDRMHPQERGRHCASCDKLVVDFSAMSDQQVIDYLAHTKHACGRFSIHQLQRPLVTDSVKARRSWFPSLVISSLFSALSMVTYSQSADQPVLNTELSHQAKEDSGESTDAPTQSVVTHIEGTVVDKETGEPLVGVPLALHGYTPLTGTLTDVDGRFRLEIPASFDGETIVLRTHYIGYEFKAVEVPRSSSTPVITIHLEQQVMALMGAVVVVHQTPMQRVKNTLLWPYRKVRYALFYK